MNQQERAIAAIYPDDNGKLDYYQDITPKCLKCLDISPFMVYNKDEKFIIYAIKRR